MSYQENDFDEDIPYSEIVNYLNEKAKTSFKATSKQTRILIRARWMEKFTFDDFKGVIDKRVADWANTEQDKYATPALP